MRSLLIILLLLSTTIIGFAQSNQATLTFEIDHHNSAAEFTNSDTKKLYKFFQYNSEIQACNQAQETTLVSRTYDETKVNYTDKDIVQELARMGFAVSNLNCDGQTIVLSIAKMIKVGNTTNDIAAKDKDCFDCGDQQLSTKLVDKFQTMDYGGNLINFDVEDDSSNMVLPAATDCNECDEIQVSDKLQNQFKDANYGGSLIDFGNTAAPQVPASNSPNQ